MCQHVLYKILNERQRHRWPAVTNKGEGFELAMLFKVSHLFEVQIHLCKGLPKGKPQQYVCNFLENWLQL